MSVPQSTQSAIENGAKGFEFREDGSFAAATGPDAVALYRLKVIQNALAFEIKTGMKMSRVSALKAANRALGTNYKRKQQALDHLTLLLGE
jgi:hypothetical protein